MLPLCVVFAVGLTSLFRAQASALVILNASPDLPPVEVGLYYESLCPYCREFVIDQLLPAYLKAPDRIKLKLVPYGNAVTYDTPEGYTFRCQHGPKECEGNKIHSCAIHLAESQESVMKLVECMIHNETDPRAVGKQCAHDLGISWRPIWQCSKGCRGTWLLKQNGDVTKALRPAIQGVPTITLNGSQQNQTAMRDDLWGAICDHLLDPKPSQCPQQNYEP